MNNDSLMPLDGSRITTQDIAIDAAQPLVLSVTNASGDISLTTTDREDVRVVAERTDSGAGNDDDARIVIDVDGNRISVHPNWQIGNTISEIARKVKHQLKEGFNSDEWDLKNMKFGMNVHFDIRIELPRQLADASSVSIKNASGDISVADIAARVSAASANGDIQLDRLHGRVSAHSASGDITLRSIDGSIEANTANGDISVSGGHAWTALRAVNGDISTHGLTMKNARITTVSGDIHTQATLNNATSYTFDTVSGDININATLPASGASLNYKAVSGDVEVSGDWTKGRGKRTWQLDGGHDGPDIRVKAVSGDLRATATSDESVTLQHETAPHNQDATRADDRDDTATEGTDIDWDRAKSWVSTVTQKITQVMNDMDDQASRKSPPSPPQPELPVPPVPPAPPHRPNRDDDDATRPVPPPSSTEDTAPVPPAWTNSAPVTPPEPVTKDAEPETNAQRRLRLLEAVQRGEMTVDEALSQLDGDETGTTAQ